MIIEIKPEQTFAIRQNVLRPRLSIAECEYPGDRENTSFHLGFILQDELVGIASFYLQPHELFPNKRSFQLRGMAIVPRHQSSGYGATLLNEGLKRCQAAHADLLWCNARVSALNFYSKLGFSVSSEEFDIPDVGPHHVMHYAFQSNAFEAWQPDSTHAHSNADKTVQ